ncbi:MAG: hypothetical protein DRH08_14665, partial [Deltaproteobacteria bacterium]
VGDVVCVPDTKMNLNVGIITRLTPKGAKVSVHTSYVNNAGKHVNYDTEYQKPIRAIVKINAELAVFMRLKGDI